MNKKMILSAAALMMMGSAAMASPVWINGAGLSSLSEVGPTVGTQKLRITNSGFEQSLDNGTVSGLTQITHEWGSISAVAFDFSVQHTASTGIMFTLTRVSDSVQKSLAWGDFNGVAGDPADSSTAKERGLIAGGGPNDRFYNTIQIEARAGNASSNVNFSDMVFTSGLTVAAGALDSAEIVNNGSSYLDGRTANQTDTLTNFYYQTIFANLTNLAAVDWTLSGRVTLTGAGSAEGLRFVVNQKNFDGTVMEIIPLPTPVAMAGAGLLAVAGLSRRRITR